MHQPRPHGRFYYGEGELDQDDAAAAELLLRRLTNLKGVSRLDALKMARTLPSGATAIAQDAGGVVRLLIYPKVERDEPEHEGIAEDYVPMLFCGAIDNGMGVPGKPIDVAVTNTTQRRLGQYVKGEEAAARLSLARFNCRIPNHLKLFGGELEPFMTQYARLRPTWWTGAMAQVVQIVGGYGRQDFDDLPDEGVERARLLIPARYRQRIAQEIENRRLPGYLGIPPEDGQFVYDMQAAKTHGVTFDAAGAPWLTQVSRAGVYAMPLPIIPATATQAFREYMEEVADHEILWALDRFGGLPSGEGFPATEDGMEAWRRAGAIIKVCETKDFYALDELSLACGWAFNSSGTEGFNTATGFGGEYAIPFCAAFKLRLRFGRAENRGWVAGRTFEGMADQARINAYMGGLLSRLSKNRDRERAIKYKLRRVEPAKIIARLGHDGATDVDYWDALEIEPIAAHIGNCAKVGQGWIYPTVLPSFKIPEPVLGGLISHTTEGLYDIDPPEKYPRCDTIIYGYYLGDDLKVVKYFYDDRELEVTEESDFEDCMIVGKWEKTQYQSPPKLQGHLYTTDFDERKEVSESFTRTNVKGVDLGYTNGSLYMLLSVWSYVFRFERRRYYGRTTNVVRHRQASRSMYCYAPFMERSALVCGYYETSKTDEKTEVAERLFVTDPNKYHAWSYDWYSRSFWGTQEDWFDWAYMPYDTSPPNPFMVMKHYYEPGYCSDWADDGEWLDKPPVDKTAYFNSGPDWHEEYGEIWGGALRYTARRPSFHEYSKRLPGDESEEFGNYTSILDQYKKLSDKEVSDFHYSTSPDSFGNVFYQDAVRIAAGVARYASLSDTGGGSPVERTRYGFSVMANHRIAQHYIGVING
jgi:hypothetical protein